MEYQTYSGNNYQPKFKIMQRKDTNKQITTIIPVWVVIVICMIIGVGCHNSTSSQEQASQVADNKTVKEAASADVNNVSSPWSYETDTDKMTSTKTYLASCVSSNSLNLSSPYSGENHGNILLRKKEGLTDVIFTIDKGQIISGVYGTTIRVRFDGNPPVRYECSNATDYDSKTLFIHPASKFIARLKKAKKTIIETTMYQDGQQLCEFEVNGLTWSH